VTGASVSTMRTGDHASVGLVGCVKSKQTVATRAGDLYTSALFKGRRAWVERNCDCWYVLSAKHGLVDPAAILEPYDESLVAKGRADRHRWAQQVLGQLGQELGELGGHRVEIHAGMAYVDFGLREGLVRCGAEVVVPTQGLRQGEHLAFYKNRARTIRG
jgi:hypothetical protein